MQSRLIDFFFSSESMLWQFKKYDIHKMFWANQWMVP